MKSFKQFIKEQNLQLVQTTIQRFGSTLKKIMKKNPVGKGEGLPKNRPTK